MEYIGFLKNTFLFSNIDSSVISEIISLIKPREVLFKRGDNILSPNDKKTTVGFIVTGKCEVLCTKSAESKVTINTLGEYESFGILSVFSNDEFPTNVVCTKKAKILFFEKEDILFMVENYPDISMNIIRFMAERIIFLNRRIDIFSGTRVEDRLAAYLLKKQEELGSSFDLNCKRASEAINAGRASVYRALSTFQSKGFIEFDLNKINIIDQQGLERILK